MLTEPTAAGGLQNLDVTDTPTSDRPSWLRPLLAPFVALVRPGCAAGWLADSTWPAALLVMVAGLFTGAVVLVGLRIWEDTVTESWAANAPYSIGSSPWEIRERTLADVWVGWHQGALWGWFGPAEMIALLVIFLGFLILVFLGWLNLPLVHRTGSAWASYRAAAQVGLVLLAPATVLTALGGAAFVLIKHASIRSDPYWFAGEPVAFAFIALATTLLVLWLHWAIRGLAGRTPPPEVGPRCEGCGYDLTHRPDHGRCPECGLALAASLALDTSRPGARWARRPTEDNWWATFFAVVFRPRRFYRQLRLRSEDDHAARFAGRNYIHLFIGACVWAFVLFCMLCARFGLPPEGQALLVPTIAGATILLGVVGCWLGHRLLAAVVSSIWLVRRELPDFRWAAQVIAYESAYLWCFCAFWGASLSSFALAEDWISRLLERWFLIRRGFFPIGEVYLVLGGTLALVVVWGLRYRSAYRAIRWSNA